MSDQREPTEAEEATPIQGPSLLRRLGLVPAAPMTDGADSDGVPNPEPWEGDNGEPLSGEYGIEDATFMDDARTLPGEGMATVSEAIAAVPVQVKQAKQWRAFKRSVAVTGEPQLIVRENESRAAIKIQYQAGTGTVQIGATEGAAMSDADSVTLSSTSDDPIYSDTIGEFWAYIAPGGTTDVVIQVQEDTY